jgi:hypothetical protein
MPTEPTIADLVARQEVTDQRMALAVDLIRLVVERLDPLSKTLDSLSTRVATMSQENRAGFASLNEATATIIDTLAEHIRDHPTG